MNIDNKRVIAVLNDVFDAYGEWDNKGQYPRGSQPIELHSTIALLSDLEIAEQNMLNTPIPPIGTMCKYTFCLPDDKGAMWFDCEIISHNKLVIRCPHLETVMSNGLQVITQAISFKADSTTMSINHIVEYVQLKNEITSAVSKILSNHFDRD